MNNGHDFGVDLNVLCVRCGASLSEKDKTRCAPRKFATPTRLTASANQRALAMVKEIEYQRDRWPVGSEMWHVYEAARLSALVQLYQAEDA